MRAIHIILRALSIAAVIATLAPLPRAARSSPWRAYTLQNGSFIDLPALRIPLPTHVRPSLFPLTPDNWHVAAHAFADATNDGAAEWALVVWRPWRDWPIQRWSTAPSPITGFRDAAGNSCHLILLAPGDGHEIWVGSALPAPMQALAVGDVDDDGRNEVVTLEGSYAAGRNGPAAHVDVWQWSSFGFTLEWRSPRGVFYQLLLTDVDNDAILDIVVR